MKCPYCAEEIKDEAVLCRFCGAYRAEGTWTSPAAQRAVTKSNFTIASSGWLLILSGIWSLASLTDPVAIFGAMRGGLVAALYNATFGFLFGAMGFALVRRRPWALRITLLTSVAYTLDKVGLIVDPGARKAALGDLGGTLGDASGAGDTVQQVMLLATLLFLVFWWSFVGYLYLKRDYFQPAATRQG